MPQTWLYIALTFCINTGASVTVCQWLPTGFWR
jgi:hypothetical protein